MTKVILNGCNGRMGRVISEIAERDNSFEIVAGVDKCTGLDNVYPVFDSLEKCDVEGNVIIDFTHASCVDALLDYAVEKSIPVVLCTTGLSEDQIKHVEEASKKVAILRSANMSVGVNLLLNLLKEAAPKLAAAGFDIEIVEKHHNQKKDAPSGTALALADAVNESLNNEYDYVYDRSSRNEARPKKEIGISAVRGGTIPGDHDVIFAGENEVVTFSHRAYSRAIFANGAIAAAKYLFDKKPGLYNMQQVLA